VLKTVRETEYDIVMDLQGLLRTAFLAFFARGRKKIGVPGMKEFSNLLIKEIEPEKRDMNAALRSIELVKAVAAGVEIKPEFELEIRQGSDESAEKLFMNINISKDDILIGLVQEARGKGKLWPKEKYTELALKLLTLGTNIKILLLGTKDSGFIHDERILNLEGKTDITQLAIVLNRCSLVIGPDTGSVHLASALGIPVIMYFGASDINETSPLAQNAKTITHNYPCSPCRSKPYCDSFPCVSGITSDEIFSAARSALKL
jgi:heptosyltransferase-1